MNKDTRHLTEAERRLLVISEEQLLIEVQARTQTHFRPDTEYQEEVEKFSWIIKCSLCKEIPFDIKQCVACESVICESCKLKLIEGDQVLNSEAGR